MSCFGILYLKYSSLKVVNPAVIWYMLQIRPYLTVQVHLGTYWRPTTCRIVRSKDNALGDSESGQIEILSKTILLNVSYMTQRRNVRRWGRILNDTV